MKPLVRGQGEFVWDSMGQRYIDAISGVYNVSYGHAHPRMVAEVMRGGERGLFNVYDNPTAERAGLECELQRLTQYSETHLFSSGAVAIEKALLLALNSLPKARRGVVHLAKGFHGKTMGTWQLFDETKDVVELPYSDMKVCPPDGPEDEERVLCEVVSVLEVCGVVIVEPVLAYYGQVLSLEFLQRLKDLCQTTSSFLIFDEMVTGFGRTGVNHVADTVRPDILVTGKGLGQGLPIVAVLFDHSSKIDETGLSWTTATSNNPFMCGVGMESCRVLVEEDMAIKSAVVGAFLRDWLGGIDVVMDFCDIESSGSMVFLKLVSGKDMSSVEMYLREKEHILTRAHGSSLVLMPPFVTQDAALWDVVNGVTVALQELREEISGG